MNLRKQLFTAFLTVAILPLIVVGAYIFATNLLLAFDLHEQNLRDSTQMQADLVEDNINRLMVRAKRFASSQAVRTACRDGAIREENFAEGFSSAVLNFTDETLDNVAIFALVDGEGDILYSSGSTDDSMDLKDSLPTLLPMDNQYVDEISLENQDNSLIIYTPVQDNKESVGVFLAVCRTDYVLKIISSHRQLESSNALIYCMSHHELVTSKQDVSGPLSELDQKIGETEQGSILCKMNGRQTLTHYKQLPKTPWVLVSTVSTGQIFSQVWSYGLINIAVLLAVFFIVVFLSRRQSRKILFPMDQLLQAVEAFFLAGATKFPQTGINPKSEIGYLAEKFTKLSDDFTSAQGKVRESNYLYAALLKATYEFRIVIDLVSDSAECSSGSLSERLKVMPGRTAPERVLAFIAPQNCTAKENGELYHIVNGDLMNPADAEAYFSPNENGAEKWYRIVAVPIIQDDKVWRVALHFEDISEQKQEELRLIVSSQTDALCGIYNKNAFPLHCQLSADGKTDALFFIDLDNFKQVNDTLGHTAGDNVLLSTAQAIRTQFRSSDVVGRFGGDEFVVFAPDISTELAEQKARRLLESISLHLDTPDDTEIHVTASIGICLMAAPVTLEKAIEFADKAMYQAKNNGRARFHLTRSDYRK